MPTNLNTLCPIPECGEELRVTVTYAVPLEVIDDQPRQQDADVSDDWEVGCVNDHVLDSGNLEIDGRPFHLSEVLTRLELLRNPGDLRLRRTVEKGWSCCDNCGEYGITGMHAGWTWVSTKGCSLTGVAAFMEMAKAGAAMTFSLYPSRSAETETASNLEDLLAPYDHAAPVGKTQKEIVPEDLRDEITNLHNMLYDTLSDGAGADIRRRYPGLAHQIDRVTRLVVNGGTF